MNAILPLFVIFVTVQMHDEMTPRQLSTRDPSSQDTTYSMAKQPSDMKLSPSSEARFLSEEEEEEERRAQQNEAAFKNLRKGLGEAQERQKNRQRLSKGMKSSEIANRLNGQSAAHSKSNQLAASVDEETLLKQAGLIEQEEITEEIDAKPVKSTYSELQTALYLAIAIIVAIYLIKCIRQRCIANQTRIQSHHEEAESLSTL